MKNWMFTLALLICSLYATAYSLAAPKAANDLAVVEVSVPDTGCLGTEAIVAVVENVGDNPAAGFSVTYRVNNTIPITTLVNETLDAGDTTLVSFANSFDFTAAGTYLLEVWVTYNNDEVPANDTLISNVVSLEKPAVAFDASLACEQAISQFIDASTHSQGIAGWQWFIDSAENVVGTDQEVSIYFPQQTQTIGLVVTANNGCVDSVKQEVSAYESPVAAFDTENGCAGEVLSFDNQSQISSGTIDTYNWHFGDGQQDTGEFPEHTYQESGFFDVVLIAISGQGCSDTADKQLEIFDIPSAAFHYDAPICAGDTVLFTDQSTVSGGFVAGRSWEFGNGDTASGSMAAQIFGEESMEVQLIATSDKGCSDTSTESVSPGPAPLAAFSGELLGCELDTLSFFNASTIDSGSIASVEWDFGDGNVSTAENPEHVYHSAGTFDVSLTAVSAMGCKGDTVVEVSVLDKPPEPVIERTGDTLYTNAEGDHQWFLFDTMITGATDSFYVADEPGLYTVEVSNAACSSVSGPIVIVGMQGTEHSPIRAHIYPNPARHSATVEISASQGISGRMQLWGMDGRMVEEIDILNNVKEWQGEARLRGKAAGTYFLVLQDASGGKLKVWPLQKAE